jgi:hypothetical protein
VTDIQNFDPYEALLRNFSKHKFKLFLEKSILNMATYSKSDYIPNSAQVHKHDWVSADFAQVDMPTGEGTAFGVTSYNRWLFHVDHMENNLIAPNMILEKARQDILKLVNRLATDKIYMKSLREVLYDNIGYTRSGSLVHIPHYGIATLYYLTNASFPKFDDKKRERFISRISNEVRQIFIKSSQDLKIDLDMADFGFGYGDPNAFLVNNRDETIRAIKEIESRPDSLQLQFVEGKIEVTTSNKRSLYAYDKEKPKLIILDEFVDSKSYFKNNEIEDFENLLNKENLTELEIQKFLEENPKFLYVLDYDEIRPQVCLADESGDALKPDFFLKPVGKRLWDILDIKLPNVNLVAGSANREGFSYNIHRGKSQLMNYADYFDNPENREKLRKITGIDCFKPRLTLLIGKKGNVNEELWNQIIAQERPFVNIVGYDELLERAKKYRLANNNL